MESLQRNRIFLRGIVQGVGFRPFIFRLATELGVSGWVSNNTEGVQLEVEGPAELLDVFLIRLQKEKPSHSVIQNIEVLPIEPKRETNFEIRSNEIVIPAEAGIPLVYSGDSRTRRDPSGGQKHSGMTRRTAQVLPDLATCSECLKEIFDPKNRRYRYPFTNCVHCGPRFSILENLPYDRENTTMKNFTMCEDCRSEYENPSDRRFHAQPNACPQCGPSLELWDHEGKILATHQAALLQTAEAIRQGKIVAMKGLGGFHLIVDARSEEAVSLLRKRKGRERKPFALMFPSLGSVNESAEVTELEEKLLLSPKSPIVLLRRRVTSDIAKGVAPNNPYLGIMLPYTPLHHLLMAELNFPIVATSGNLSEEPICIENQEALDRLKEIADLFLIHNRPIARSIDDSIVRIMSGREMILRRARGYAPFYFSLESPLTRPTATLFPRRGEDSFTLSFGERAGVRGNILALGGHLKNTIALTIDQEILVSQHIGDLQNTKAMEGFEETIQNFQKFYDLKPTQVVCDLHPDYASTRYASELNLPLLQVQHHHAHVVSCMAEHHLQGPVLGIAWDGTGYGTDGTIWGGEFLLSTRNSFKRVGHFLNFRLPGGESAIWDLKKIALGILYEVFGERLPSLYKGEGEGERSLFSKTEFNLLKNMLTKKINSPLTSSVGRLFDGIAAMLDLCEQVSFEGEAAMQLEFAAEKISTAEFYSLDVVPAQAGISQVHSGDFCLRGNDSTITEMPTFIFDWRPMILEILKDQEKKVAVPLIARKFHNTLVECILQAARRLGEKQIVLTGGCFQNRLLTENAIQRLREEEFEPFWHQRIPPNDGGIALGQAVIGVHHVSSNPRKNCSDDQ